MLFTPQMRDLLLEGLVQTLVMVGVSGGIAVAAGLPLAVVLLTTGPGHLFANRPVHLALGLAVNATRSTPFIILMVAIVPLTRLLAGTSIGTEAAIVPLSIAATAFLARLFEAALREVDRGLIEAAAAMGATRIQIVAMVLVPEALPALAGAVTITLVSLVGFSAMAGVIGGGGLGDLGIRFGYQRYMPEVMGAVVLALILLVQFVQSAGDLVVRRLSRK
jgi:D-methionine transport system permease protein